MKLRIKKILNSSVVLVTNAQGEEVVVLGKGIGYGAHRGDLINPSDVDQWFYPVRANEVDRVEAVLSESSADAILVARKIMERAIARLGDLDPNLFIALVDHIDFVLDRLKQGLLITNKIYWEIRNYYPDEFAIGSYAVDLIDSTFGVKCPKDEAANIALHVINANRKLADVGADGMKVASLVDGVMNLIRYQLPVPLVKDSLDYQRLVTHVKFFAQRVLSDNQLDDATEEFSHYVRSIEPKAEGIVNKVSLFVTQKTGIAITQAEENYLILYVTRLLQSIGSTH